MVGMRLRDQALHVRFPYAIGKSPTMSHFVLNWDHGTERRVDRLPSTVLYPQAYLSGKEWSISKLGHN